jgi:hypothetical protein
VSDDVIFDRDAGIFDGTLVPPSFSRDGNVGIEQTENYIGAYTRCCLYDPENTGSGWKCAKCEIKLSVYLPTYADTTLELKSSSEADIRHFLAGWLDTPADFIEVQVEWPED